MKEKKIVIIGIGTVGAAIAYTATLENICDEIVLISTKEKKAIAEVKDIQHSMLFKESSPKIKSGAFEDVKDADVVIFTAAGRVKFGQTRLDMIQKNIDIVDSIIPKVIENGFDGTFLVVSNPVDVLSYYICKQYNIDFNKVIGTGTVLDTARLKGLLSTASNTSVESIDGFCVGEHGDSLVIPWSHVKIQGKNVDLDADAKEKMRLATINEAYEIVKGKGNTSYGVAMATLRIVKALLGSDDVILPVSVLLNGQYGIDNVSLSVPAKLSNGVVREVVEVDLEDNEIQALIHSAEVLKDTIAKI